MSQERRRIFYSGHVQGVGFRWATVNALKGIPVTGFVQNLPDGRVELVMEGLPADLDLGEQRVLSAMGRNIRSLAQSVEAPTGEFRHFEIRQ